MVFSRKGFHVKSVFLFFVWSTFCCVVYNKWYHSRRFQLRSAAPGDSPLRSRSSIVAALFNGSASRRSRHRAALPRSSIHRSETQSSKFSSMSGAPVFGDPSAKLDSARRDRSDRSHPDRQSRPTPGARPSVCSLDWSCLRIRYNFWSIVLFVLYSVLIPYETRSCAWWPLKYQIDPRHQVPVEICLAALLLVTWRQLILYSHVKARSVLSDL